ncbi:hypothetical protein V5E97_29980 [Singulisphaera sp. Ch08]|uniref:Uncharacterized protein n=1 Tax=Singulisphaera sp. Ch08 TaxID=3120278 RepID=A0AAU7CBJ0_9BACT
MNHQKSDRSDREGFSNSIVSQERDRINGQRSLERMGLVSFDRPRRNPYWDLDILGLMRVPQREDRTLVLSAIEDRDASGVSRETPWPEESPRSSEGPKPLLL